MIRWVRPLQNFARNKTRTLLSLLGVIIGVASVIVITSMGASSTQEIQDTFGTSGPANKVAEYLGFTAKNLAKLLKK